LYNLETYHTLKYNQGAYMIDDGLNVSVKTPIKLFFNEDLIADSDKLRIFPGLGLKNYPRPVYTTYEGCFTLLKNGLREMKYGNLNTLSPHNVLTGFNTTEAIYTKVYFKRHTTIEIFLGSEEGGFEIVGNPIIGRYKYECEYDSPSWNITANAVVYASGLKIQWGNFNPHSASDDTSAVKGTYFPVMFDNTPSMSFTFNANSDHTVYYQDCPCAVSNEKWKLYKEADGNIGTWIAIGY
jgi:hypothetical protein